MIDYCLHIAIFDAFDNQRFVYISEVNDVLTGMGFCGKCSNNLPIMYNTNLNVPEKEIQFNEIFTRE